MSPPRNDGHERLGSFHRQYLDGDLCLLLRPGRQGQREGSKLDPHENFILGLGFDGLPGHHQHFFDKRGITHKNDGARQRAAAHGCESCPAKVV